MLSDFLHVRGNTHFCLNTVHWCVSKIIDNNPKGGKDIKPIWILICSLIGPSQCHDTDDLLALTNPEVRRAFEDFLLPTDSDRTRAHLVLAGKVHTACFNTVLISVSPCVFKLVLYHYTVSLYSSSVGTGRPAGHRHLPSLWGQLCHAPAFQPG